MSKGERYINRSSFGFDTKIQCGNISRQFRDLEKLVDEASGTPKPLKSNFCFSQQFFSKAKEKGGNEVRKKYEALFQMGNSKEKKEVARGIISKNRKSESLSIFAKIIVDMADLLAYQKKLFVYQEPVWSELAEREFTILARELLESDEVINCLSMHDFKEIFNKVLTNPEIQAKKEDMLDAKKYICMADGVIDVCSGEIYEPSPDFKFFSHINISVKELENTEGYYFESFVENASNGDENWRTFLLEIVGCIISGIATKKFFVLCGPKNSGKSQFANLCKGLVGDELCASIKGPNDFAGRWTTGTLFGKKLCLAADAPNVLIKPEAIAEIKRITGDDWLNGERKGKDIFTFRNEATIVICTNHALKLSEQDDAFIDRLTYVPFYNSVPPEKRIPNMSEKLLLERGYIVKEALAALRALLARNLIFTEVDSGVCLTQNSYSEDRGVVFEFIMECCSELQGEFVEFAKIYEAFMSFCEINRSPVTNKITFSREFKAVVSEVLPNVKFKPTAKAKGYLNLALI